MGLFDTLLSLFGSIFRSLLFRLNIPLSMRAMTLLYITRYLLTYPLLHTMVSPSLWKFLKESNNFSRKYPFYVKWQQWWHIKKGTSSSVVTFRAILFSEKTWDGQLDGSCQMFQNFNSLSSAFEILLTFPNQIFSYVVTWVLKMTFKFINQGSCQPGGMKMIIKWHSLGGLHP